MLICRLISYESFNKKRRKNYEYGKKKKKDEFNKIINHEEDEVITLYFLTHEKGMEVNEDKDSLQFKNV